MGLAPRGAGDHDRGREEGEPVLALLVDVRGVGRVVEHVDGVAVGKRIVRRRHVLDVSRGGQQQVLGRPLHPEPAERIAIDDRLSRPQIERREADRQPEREGDVVERIQVRRGDPPRQVKESDDREVLRLIAWEGLESREAAAVFGCSYGAFRVRLHRARRRLEKQLAAAGHSADEVRDIDVGAIEEIR